MAVLKRYEGRQDSIVWYRQPSAGENNAVLVFYRDGASIEQCCAAVITQEPNGYEGSGFEEQENVGSRAEAGRNGTARLHVCVDWMVPPSGS